MISYDTPAEEVAAREAFCNHIELLAKHLNDLASDDLEVEWAIEQRNVGDSFNRREMRGRLALLKRDSLAAFGFIISSPVGAGMPKGYEDASSQAEASYNRMLTEPISPGLSFPEISLVELIEMGNAHQRS